MSYEKDQFGGGSGDITSASVSAALALKQPNFSVADEGVTLSTIAGTVTTINFTGTGISASLTGGLLTVTAVAGAGSGEGSVSVSNMILTALGPYLTSASAAAAYLTSNSASAMIASQLSPYITSNSVSIALATYVTSGSLATALGPYVTSGSLTTALGGYVTSTSLATALGGYLTSGSFGTAIAPYLTSASAAAVYVTSASLATTLGTYLTSSSFTTAIAPYVTSASLVTTLGTYVTSSSLNTALATYATSNSVSIGLATKQPNFNVADEGVTLTTVAGTVTTINFVGTGISASLTGGLLTVTAVAGAGSGEGSVSVSDMITARLATAPGMVLLGSVSASIGLGGAFRFSGSWSDYAMLELRATYRPNGTSLTASVAIYTDGGTTPFLSFNAGTVSAGAFYNLTCRVALGGGFKTLQYENATAAARTQGFTATSNTGFVNALALAHGTAASATISIGLVQLFGLRR